MHVIADLCLEEENEMQTMTAGTHHGLLLVAAAWLAPIGSTLFAPVLPHVGWHLTVRMQSH